VTQDKQKPKQGRRTRVNLLSYLEIVTLL